MRPFLKELFDKKDWSNNSGGPRSGHGSTLKATRNIRTALPELFSKYNVQRFVDAPCGDWTWMQTVDLDGVSYLGCDIAPSLINENTKTHVRENVKFEVLDITSSPLPPSDLFLCRECLFHLKYWLRWEFFKNFANSDGKYLMTTIDHVIKNRNVPQNAGFRRFDPRLHPFNLPEPIEIIPENYTRFSDNSPEDSDTPWKFQSSGIWSIDQIQSVVKNHFEAN